MKRRYSVDQDNRLLVRTAQGAAFRPRGFFRINKRNALEYWLNEPLAWRRKYGLPRTVTFQGNWELSQDHSLELVLRKSSTQYPHERLSLRGKIISCDNDALAFEVISRQPSAHIERVALSGRWSMDEHNRVIFIVKKDAASDTLVFTGVWQVGRDQQISYSYTRTDLSKRVKATHNLQFEGYWELRSDTRIRYILTRSSASIFEFRAQVESPTIYPKKGSIRYRVGAGLKEAGRKHEKVIILYGTWKFSRSCGLMFEMEYGKGRFRSMSLGADVRVKGHDTLGFLLKSSRGDPLGIELVYTRKFLQRYDAEGFVRLRRYMDNRSGVEIGVRVPF